jgi:hypothetical protein
VQDLHVFVSDHRSWTGAIWVGTGS